MPSKVSVGGGGGKTIVSLILIHPKDHQMFILFIFFMARIPLFWSSCRVRSALLILAICVHLLTHSTSHVVKSHTFKESQGSSYNVVLCLPTPFSHTFRVRNQERRIELDSQKLVLYIKKMYYKFTCIIKNAIFTSLLLLSNSVHTAH